MKILQHPLPGHGFLKPWGIMVHTTGDGIPRDAYKEGVGLLEKTIETYAKMEEGPHYVILPGGQVVQFRQHNQRAWHVGVSVEQRRDFLSGFWESKAPMGIPSWWKARWKGRKSPSHLYPSEQPNTDYIGIELVPCGTYLRGPSGSWQPIYGKPAHDRGRFTGAQYAALALLCNRLSDELHIPLESAPDSGRLLGHEDVNPITRPGWDPGDAQGFFNWPLLLGLITGLRLHSVAATE